MLVLYMTMRLRAPWCRSLKDKRSQVKKLLAALRSKFEVSCAESGLQDSHTLIELSLCALAPDRAYGDSLREAVIGHVQQASDAQLYEDEAEYR